MARHLTIARPYAIAVFNEAWQNETVSHWTTVLNGLAQLSHDAEIKRVIDDPVIMPERRLALLEGLLSDLAPDAVSVISTSLKQFLMLLSHNKRLEALADIEALFLEQVAEKAQTLPVKVISAMPMDDHQRNALIARLKTRFEAKVSAEFVVDPMLLGGVVIHVGPKVIDGSVRGYLKKLAECLH